jgi:hypothetical protein
MTDEKNSSTERWIGVRVFGSRREGHDGWWVEQSDLTLDEARQAIAVAGHKLIEVREVSSGAKRLNPGEEFKPDTSDLWFLQGMGWGYDNAAQCWRAPGEPITPLPGTPAETTGLTVEYKMPEYGWLPIRISAGAQRVEFSASVVYDPLPALIRWLEDLAAGSFPRLAMDLEGSETEWMVWPAADADQVRFAVSFSGNATKDGRREIQIDVLTGRRGIVEAIYPPLMDLYGTDEFVTRWYGPEDDDPPPQPPPILRSETIDRYLAQQRARLE